MEDIFTIANKNFKSRLIVGTGKYKNFEETAEAIKESGSITISTSFEEHDSQLKISFLTRI